MFVNTIEFPAIKPEDELKYREWFKWSNEMYRKFDGFISRRLLQRTKGGEPAYVTLVEHKNEQTFMRMHTSPERQHAFERLKPLLGNAVLKVQFFEVIED
ncbi:MAG: antibiotic biosynthesis monooxygenase [Ignavibacteriales bacterium]|nr:antibiotic biosynthesis monooxygenase [Ignavibacteriales bacterium]